MVKIAAPISLLILGVQDVLADNPCGQGSSECDDSPGDFGECCIDQSTFCVAPRGSFVTSTCCPRWTVGCQVGSVGCCDPARPWQLVTPPAVNGTRTPNRRAKSSEQSPNFVDEAANAQSLAYALFTESFKGGLSAVTIDAATGQVVSKQDVTGPAADWYKLYFGESTRILPWDAASARFVFADADLDSGKLTVYTINPSTGQSTGQAVSGCAGSPVGLAWDADAGALVVTTQTNTEASFFSVNPDTGAARPLGTVQRGSDEATSESFYAAYLSHVHAGVAYRSGLKKVFAGDDEGFGVTQLPGSSDEGSSAWKDAVKADGHGLPVSLQRHPDGGFIALAPNSLGKLDVVSWTADGTAKMVGKLNDANMPQTPGTGPLGYVADAPVVGDVYASMTVTIVPGTLGVGDKWTLNTLSLSTGEVAEFPLTPQPSALGAETVSLTGFGIPAQQSVSV